MMRAFSTLTGAAIAGGLLWVAAQVSDVGTGGYWGRIGIVVAAGLALSLARLPETGVRTLAPSIPTLTVAFLPALVAVGWIVVAAQPNGNGARGHVLAWSTDIGISRVVGDLLPLVLVLAFGLGTVLGLVFERRAVVSTAVEPVPAPTAQAGTVAADPDLALTAEQPSAVDEADTVVAGRRELVHN
jgi:hypothetical protein